MLFKQQVGGENGTEFSRQGTYKENEFLNAERPEPLKKISPFDYQ